MTTQQPSRRRLALAAGVALAFAALAAGEAAVGSMVATAAAPAAVEIRDFHFVPQTLTVTAGTRVTWTNQDTSPHTIAAADMAFRSPALDTKDRFSHTFTAPGEYVYRCTLHPMMVGKIVVKSAS